MSKKLGRGLAALIPDYSSVTEEEKQEATLKELALTLISRNKFQPRITFESDGINELASSIKENGLIQPVVVRKTDNNNYELISGERRLRAVESLGYPSIPAIVKEDISDKQSQIMALLENIQRVDISPVETAKAYHSILADHGYTHQELSDKLGKSRATISNTLRLLDLSPACIQALETNQISEGHARVLLHEKNFEAQNTFLNKIIQNTLSVREAESMIYQNISTTKSASSKRLTQIASHTFTAFYDSEKSKGAVSIKYKNSEELKKILHLLAHA